MQCDQFKNNLFDFFEGNLSEEKKNEIEAHIQTCAACKVVFTNINYLFLQLENEKKTEVNPYFTNKVLAKISSENEQKKPMRNIFFSIPSRVTAIALATGVVAGLALGIFLLPVDADSVNADELKNELVSDNDNTILTLNDE